MRSPAKIPSVGDVPYTSDSLVKRFLGAVKEILEVREGVRGSDSLDKFIAHRDLVNIGLLDESLSILEEKFDYNPASLADGAGATAGPITVAGAKLGDFVMASFSLDLQGILLTGWVSEANNVKVRFQNETGGVIDLGAGTIRVRITKPKS